MNRRHWLKAITATIAALLLPKAKARGVADDLLAEYPTIKSYVDERLQWMRDYEKFRARAQDAFRTDPYWVKYREEIRASLQRVIQ